MFEYTMTTDYTEAKTMFTISQATNKVQSVVESSAPIIRDGFDTAIQHSQIVSDILTSTDAKRFFRLAGYVLTIVVLSVIWSLAFLGANLMIVADWIVRRAEAENATEALEPYHGEAWFSPTRLIVEQALAVTVAFLDVALSDNEDFSEDSVEPILKDQ